MKHSADDQLRRALQDLPEVNASPGFTRRVMEGLTRRQARRRRRNQLTLSAATAIVLALIVGILVVDRSAGPSPAQLADEARLLRQEHARLRSELEALSASERDAAPVLYLGGDDTFDLVLDLAPMITQPAPAARSLADTVDPYEL